VRKKSATPQDAPGKPGYCSSNDSYSGVRIAAAALSGFAPNPSFRAAATSLQRAQAQSSFGADPDFLYAALDTTARGAFIKESRMKYINADNLHRKSGVVSCSLLSKLTYLRFALPRFTRAAE
jgi:hypothetical protein